MNYKEIGQIAEHELGVLLAMRGLRVSYPMIDNYPYDLIVDTGCNLIKVQVKTVSYRRDQKNKSSYYTCLIARGSGVKTKYSNKDIDLFAIRIAD